MKVEWTQPALADLNEAEEYIARENPQAAAIVAQRIWDASQALADNPEMGRKGEVVDTREWVIEKTAYLFVYQILNDQIDILRLWHGHQNWKVR